jgi:hypothetical protein
LGANAAATSSRCASLPDARTGPYEAAKTKDGKLADHDGKMLTVKKQRPRLLSDLSPEARKLIEEVVLDRNGNFLWAWFHAQQLRRVLVAS